MWWQVWEEAAMLVRDVGERNAELLMAKRKKEREKKVVGIYIIIGRLGGVWEFNFRLPKD